jgi:hypothetical protein
VLTQTNYLDYIWNEASSKVEAVYLPLNTVTPSEIEGMSLEEERKFRVYGCELIQDAGILLKMPNIVLSTA